LQTSIDKSISENVNDDGILDDSLLIKYSHKAQDITFENKKQFDLPIHNNFIAAVKSEFPGKVNEDLDIIEHDGDSTVQKYCR